jgi:hypothetical protein
VVQGAGDHNGKLWVSSRERGRSIEMNKLVDFFGASVERLGAFYPTHCLMAIFRNQAGAELALHKVLNAGFASSDVIAADGEAVLEFDKDETDLARFIMRAVSRFFATEQVFADHDLADARHGAGFLAVRCPTDGLKNTAWSVIELEAPLDARYYSRLGIEHLAGDFKTN